MELCEVTRQVGGGVRSGEGFAGMAELAATLLHRAENGPVDR